MPDMSQFSPYLDFILGHLFISLLVTALVFTVLLLLVMRRSQPLGSVLEVFFRSYLFWTLTLLFVRDAVRLGAFGPDAAAGSRIHARVPGEQGTANERNRS